MSNLEELFYAKRWKTEDIPESYDTADAQAYCNGWSMQEHAESELGEELYAKLHEELKQDQSEYGKWKLAGWDNNVIVGELYDLAEKAEVLGDDSLMKSWCKLYDEVCANFYFEFSENPDIVDPTDAMKRLVNKYRVEHALEEIGRPGVDDILGKKGPTL